MENVMSAEATETKTCCDKCQRERKTLHDYQGKKWCGTCISRYERQQDTREMYGRGRRGY